MCISRLKWQCRRGMLELDHLLTHWLEQHYPAAGDDEKCTFRELLQLPDDELAAYILGNETPRSERFRIIVARIRGDLDA